MVAFLQISPNCRFQVSNWPGFAGSGMKVSLNLRGGISKHGPKIFIFSVSCGTFLFESFGPGVNIRLNLRGGLNPKCALTSRRCLYVFSWKAKVTTRAIKSKF